jgi:hypothetical protein
MKDKKEFERLYKLTTADMVDKMSAYDLMKRYVDKDAIFCLTCDPSVSAMFKRLKGWFEINKDNIK